MKIVILAAGKGTRFLPITKETPKALIPILSRPLVEYNLDLYAPYVDGIIFVVNDILGFKIREYFGDQYKKIPIYYAVQNLESSGGTFSALLCASPFIDTEKFIVCNCDDLYRKEDIDRVFNQSDYGIGLTVSKMPYIYHGVDTDNGYVKGFRYHDKVEDLVEDKFVNGFYFLPKSVLSFSPVFLKNGESGLPHTLFANLDKLPLREFPFSDWAPVDGPSNIETAERFIRKYYRS